MIKSFIERCRYRFWQFKQVLMPVLDVKAWQEATSELDAPLRAQLNRLRKSEKAHVMRVYRAVCADQGFDARSRADLLKLALLHDIGKSITRPSIFYKVAKVLLGLTDNSHCLAGARFLRASRQNRLLIRRVLRHHDRNSDDALLRAFQLIDDSN